MNHAGNEPTPLYQSLGELKLSSLAGALLELKKLRIAPRDLHHYAAALDLLDGFNDECEALRDEELPPGRFTDFVAAVRQSAMEDAEDAVFDNFDNVEAILKKMEKL